jgi:hypothetical protein
MSENLIKNIENKTYCSDNIKSEFALEQFSIDSENVRNIVLEEKNFIFPVDWTDISEHTFFNSAYTKTRNIADKLIREWPIGRNGNIVESWDATTLTSITSGETSAKTVIQGLIDQKTYWKEDLEPAIIYYNNLTNYEKWVLKQLCGATIFYSQENSISAFQTYKQATFQISGAYISSTSSLTSEFVDLSNSDQDYVVYLPALLRDNTNYLIPPFGWQYSQSPDYNDNIVATFNVNASRGDVPFYEILLSTAIAFDEGIHFALTRSGGTGSHEFIWTNYDGIQENQIYPDVDKYSVNRPVQLKKLVPPVTLLNDEELVLDRFLGVMADMLDDTKLYIDNFTNLFKNYWSNWRKIPMGMIQKMVAFQLGVELFSSSNNGISDLVLRNKRSITDVTYEFWNRILCTLIYAYKTKSTIESIKSIVRAYGFPETMLEVEELCKKYYSHDHYKYDVQSTPIARFGDNSTSSELVAVSFNTSYDTNTTPDIFSVSFRFRETTTTSNTDGYRVICTNTDPVVYDTIDNFSIQIKKQDDPNNANNQYNSFTINLGKISLTTNYDFWKSINATQDDMISFCVATIAEDSTFNNPRKIAVYIGKVQESIYYTSPNVAYFEVDVDAGDYTTSYLVGDYYSCSSYSASSFHTSLTSMKLGAESSSPMQLYMQEFLIDTNFVTYDQFQTRVNNFENYSNIEYSSFSSVLVYYKLKENVDFSTSGEDYIIDGSMNGNNGTPILDMPASAMVEAPYGKFSDLFKSIKYRDAGFNIPISSRLSDVTTKDIKLTNLRIGISSAKSINEDIENYLGDVEISDMMFDPVEFFNEVPSYENLLYTNLENKKDDIFSRYNETFKPWKLTTFIERVEGHLASFFSFIEQFIPIKEKVIEKGIIYENYSLCRTRLRKPWISSPYDAILPIDIDLNVESDIEILLNHLATIDQLPDIATTLLDNLNLALTGIPNIITDTISPYTSVLDSIDSKNDITVNTILPDSGCLDVRVGAEVSDVKIYDTVSLHVPLISNAKVIDSINITSKILQDSIKSNIYSIDYLKPSSYNSARYEDFKIDMSFIKRDIFVSTSHLKNEKDKKLEGYILINNSKYNNLSKFCYQNKEVVQIDTKECKNVNSLNQLRIFIDDIELDVLGEIYEVPYKYKRGIKFVITSIGSASEGIDVNEEIKVKFKNMINQDDDIIVLNFYIGFSMNEFATQKGYSLVSNIN